MAAAPAFPPWPARALGRVVTSVIASGSPASEAGPVQAGTARSEAAADIIPADEGAWILGPVAEAGGLRRTGEVPRWP